MSDPSQQCPSAWREYNTSGVRACGRPNNSPGSCEAICYSAGQTYSRVCGRVIGYQYVSPDAFKKHANNHIDLSITLAHNKIVFGVTLLISHRVSHQSLQPSVLALLTMDKKLICNIKSWEREPGDKAILVVITTVNLVIQTVVSETTYTIMIHYGMASSVKVPAAMVPTLPHGSAYSFLLQQLT